MWNRVQIAAVVSAILCGATLPIALGQHEHPGSLLLHRGKEQPRKRTFPTLDFIEPLETIQPKPIKDDCMELARKPSGRDIEKRRLLRKLGGEENFNGRYLSLSKPQSDEPMLQEVSLRRVSTAQKNHLKDVIRNETKHMAGIKGTVPVHMERFMMKWLMHKSFCPVEYVWRDMGLCFWPRWLSVGSCVNKECSWPSQMQCKPSKATSVEMLRWYCPQSGNDRRTPRSEPRKNKRNKNKRRRKCRWLNIRYPVTTQCKCSCDQDERLRF